MPEIPVAVPPIFPIRLIIGNDENNQADFMTRRLYMWYFTWALGISFAVLLSILNALWSENEASRLASMRGNNDSDHS